MNILSLNLYERSNNKHNIIETYNYPLRDEPYIEVISDNNFQYFKKIVQKTTASEKNS